MLHALCVTFAGQPVGLSTLAVAVSEEPDTVEEVYEPFLLKQGLLLRTPRGRVATPAAYAHLGVPTPPGVVTLFDDPIRSSVLRPGMPVFILYFALLAVASSS